VVIIIIIIITDTGAVAKFWAFNKELKEMLSFLYFFKTSLYLFRYISV